MQASMALAVAGLLIAGVMLNAAPAQTAAEAAAPTQSQAGSAPAEVASFFQAVSGLFQGIEQSAKNVDATVPATPAVKPDNTKPARAEATQADPSKQRSWKNSMILISGGAASGAAIGAAVTKDRKGAIVGAVAGGVAGLIYDRITYKNPGKI
jgi:hypothetical protein